MVLATARSNRVKQPYGINHWMCYMVIYLITSLLSQFFDSIYDSTFVCGLLCRHIPDDIDLVADEAAEAARLASLLPQLKAAADTEGGRRTGSGMVAAYDGFEVGEVEANKLASFQACVCNSLGLPECCPAP